MAKAVWPPLFSAGTSSECQTVILIPIDYESGSAAALAELIVAAYEAGYDYRKTVRTQTSVTTGGDGQINLFHLFVSRELTK